LRFEYPTVLQLRRYQGCCRNSTVLGATVGNVKLAGIVRSGKQDLRYISIGAESPGCVAVVPPVDVLVLDQLLVGLLKFSEIIVEVLLILDDENRSNGEPGQRNSLRNLLLHLDRIDSNGGVRGVPVQELPVDTGVMIY
jgi:hypothetical protein